MTTTEAAPPAAPFTTQQQDEKPRRNNRAVCQCMRVGWVVFRGAMRAMSCRAHDIILTKQNPSQPERIIPVETVVTHQSNSNNSNNSNNNRYYYHS